MIDKVLRVATLISIATYLFYLYLPKGLFYIGNGVFIFMLCLIIFIQNKSLFISFFLLCISINNLVDEIVGIINPFLEKPLYDPTKLNLNELILVFFIPIVYYARQNRKLRIIRFFNKNYISSLFSGWCKNSDRSEEKQE